MKRRVTLSGNKMPTREAMHAYLAKKLKFPAYYGKNLDALHDCLGEIAHPIHITVTYTDRLAEELGEYGKTFLQVLQDAAEKNEFITVSVYTDKRY